ncbi:MAG: hypothetical protein IPH55_16640 [Betaproteobacteria bacterium]|nr:hypothetical protein [Betaproteobacteria bacterium]
MADDIVHAFLRRLAQWAPPDEVQRAELEFRQEWGGANVYVVKDSKALKTQALAGSLAAGASLREAFDIAGVSRRTGYRLLSGRCR